MPGQGRAVERAYTPKERTAIGDNLRVIGDKTFDIYLNGKTFWRNVPASVWTYRLGGYQVLKKWLSYREHEILGRALKSEEAQYFSEMARRIAALMQATQIRRTNCELHDAHSA